MAHGKLQPDPAPHSELIELLAPLTGNELKLIIVITERAIMAQPLTMAELAKASGLDRSTVWRLIPSLCDKGYLELRPTNKALRLTELARRQILGSPEVAVMLHIPSHDAVEFCNTHQVNPPSQNATQSYAPRNTPRSAQPSQQLTGTKGLTGFASEYCQRGKDFARQSAKRLDDVHSLGMHTQLWYEALSIDEQTKTNTCENSIWTIVADLQDRFNRTGRRQGAAFTARVKAMLFTARKHKP